MPGRSRFAVSLPLICAIACYALLLPQGGAVLHDPDTYLHIAVGRWIIAHHAVPHTGVFSATMAEAPWVAHGWLGEVLLAAIYDHLGWAGLVAVTLLCTAAALAILLRALLRSLVPVHALIAAALAFALAVPHVLARPHIFALPILVLWVAALARARSEERAPPLWLAMLMAPWANLHGGFVFGLGIAAMLGAEAVVVAPDWRARLPTVRGWGLFGALALAAAWFTPFGVEGLVLPFRLTGMSFALTRLQEWQSPNFQNFQPLEMWLMVVLFAALTFGWRLPWTRLLMILLLLHLALRHTRHGELLGFAAPLLAAPALAAQLRASTAGRRTDAVDRGLAELAKPATRSGLALAAAILLALSVGLLRGSAMRPDIPMPAAALAAAEAAHVTGPLLNDYGFGGWLIFSGVAPFIDGRAELYGDAFIERYVEAMLLANRELPQLLDQHAVAWTLIAPDRPAAVLLDHLPGWRRLYADGIAIVHVREPTGISSTEQTRKLPQ